MAGSVLHFMVEEKQSYFQILAVVSNYPTHAKAHNQTQCPTRRPLRSGEREVSNESSVCCVSINKPRLLLERRRQIILATLVHIGKSAAAVRAAKLKEKKQNLKQRRAQTLTYSIIISSKLYMS